MLDKKALRVVAGVGGNGSISFRRERAIAFGGPDGGDGGSGGSVIFYANSGVRTLTTLSRITKIAADNGQPGSGYNKTGKSGKSKKVPVPIGTQIWHFASDRKGALIADLSLEGQSALIAKGGEPGRGNIHFVTPTNQEPLLAEVGSEGDQLDVLLEVKLLADVAIIGPPNAGKSTLLSTVSAAKPVVAPFPFTTLEPVLGTVDHRGERMVLLEVPGLIEGAHRGRGLGLEFLRHVERASAVLQLVDGADENLIKGFTDIDAELSNYGAGLEQKPRIVAVTKLDLPEVEKRLQGQRFALENLVQGKVEAISAASNKGLVPLLDRMLVLIRNSFTVSAPNNIQITPNILTKPENHRPRIEKQDDIFLVSCKPAERIAGMVKVHNWKARMQFHAELGRLGVIRALENAGVSSGDSVRIGPLDLEWQ